MSYSLIKKIVTVTFQHHKLKLSEAGELHFFELREFFNLCDVLQTYMANLGTQALVQDIKKLISQRGDLQKEITQLQTKVDAILLQEKIEKSEVQSYGADRGGDSRLLQLSEALVNHCRPLFILCLLNCRSIFAPK
jgi:hypothetical protein